MPRLVRTGRAGEPTLRRHGSRADAPRSASVADHGQPHRGGYEAVPELCSAGGRPCRGQQGHPEAHVHLLGPLVRCTPHSRLASFFTARAQHGPGRLRASPGTQRPPRMRLAPPPGVLPFPPLPAQSPFCALTRRHRRHRLPQHGQARRQHVQQGDDVSEELRGPLPGHEHARDAKDDLGPAVDGHEAADGSAARRRGRRTHSRRPRSLVRTQGQCARGTAYAHCVLGLAVSHRRHATGRAAARSAHDGRDTACGEPPRPWPRAAAHSLSAHGRRRHARSARPDGDGTRCRGHPFRAVGCSSARFAHAAPLGHDAWLSGAAARILHGPFPRVVGKRVTGRAAAPSPLASRIACARRRRRATGRTSRRPSPGRPP